MKTNCKYVFSLLLLSVLIVVVGCDGSSLGNHDLNKVDNNSISSISSEDGQFSYVDEFKFMHSGTEIESNVFKSVSGAVNFTVIDPVARFELGNDRSYHFVEPANLGKVTVTFNQDVKSFELSTIVQDIYSGISGQLVNIYGQANSNSCLGKAKSYSSGDSCQLYVLYAGNDVSVGQNNLTFIFDVNGKSESAVMKLLNKSETSGQNIANLSMYPGSDGPINIVHLSPNFDNNVGRIYFSNLVNNVRFSNIGNNAVGKMGENNVSIAFGGSNLATILPHMNYIGGDYGGSVHCNSGHDDLVHVGSSCSMVAENADPQSSINSYQGIFAAQYNAQGSEKDPMIIKSIFPVLFSIGDLNPEINVISASESQGIKLSLDIDAVPTVFNMINIYPKISNLSLLIVEDNSRFITYMKRDNKLYYDVINSSMSVKIPVFESVNANRIGADAQYDKSYYIANIPSYIPGGIVIATYNSATSNKVFNQVIGYLNTDDYIKVESNFSDVRRHHYILTDRLIKQLTDVSVGSGWYCTNGKINLSAGVIKADCSGTRYNVPGTVEKMIWSIPKDHTTQCKNLFRPDGKFNLEIRDSDVDQGYSPHLGLYCSDIAYDDISIVDPSVSGLFTASVLAKLTSGYPGCHNASISTSLDTLHVNCDQFGYSSDPAYGDACVTTGRDFELDLTKCHKNGNGQYDTIDVSIDTPNGRQCDRKSGLFKPTNVICK